MTDIRIPEEIKPVDGRFGSGPSKVRPEGVEALSAVSRTLMGTSHRQRTVKDQVARLRRGLGEFFGLPDGYEVILSNGGTSAFWDTATFGLVRDKAQFASFGEVGAKFVKAVRDAPFLADPTVHQAPGGQAAFLQAMNNFVSHGNTGMDWIFDSSASSHMSSSSNMLSNCSPSSVFFICYCWQWFFYSYLLCRSHSYSH